MLTLLTYPLRFDLTAHGTAFGCRPIKIRRFCLNDKSLRCIADEVERKTGHQSERRRALIDQHADVIRRDDSGLFNRVVNRAIRRDQFQVCTDGNIFQRPEEPDTMTGESFISGGVRPLRFQ